MTLELREYLPKAMGRTTVSLTTVSQTEPDEVAVSRNKARDKPLACPPQRLHTPALAHPSLTAVLGLTPNTRAAARQE